MSDRIVYKIISSMELERMRRDGLYQPALTLTYFVSSWSGLTPWALKYGKKRGRNDGISSWPGSTGPSVEAFE
jgi:hypothetical protein